MSENKEGRGGEGGRVEEEEGGKGGLRVASRMQSDIP